MSVTIDATVGGGSSNSYVTVDEADSYFAARLNSTTWTNASADDKASALIMATRRLDQEDFEGVKTNPDPNEQILEWPRAGATDQNDWAYRTDVLPPCLKYATYELALVMLGSDAVSDTGLEGFEAVQVGSLRVTPRQQHLAGTLPREVARLLSHVLSSGGANVRLLRA